MYSRAPLASLCLAALVVSGVSVRVRAQDANSNKDQSTAGEQTKPASDQSDKEKNQDLKPATSDEGQLATVKDAKIPSYSKVYVAPMPDGFENYIIAGMRKKQVPLIVVVDRTKADYEISGVSDSEKAGWAKMLFMGSQQSNEQASIKVSDLKTGAVIFGYSVHKGNSYRGRQSAGEACAKHLKEIVVQ
jgi:hypothetical protein